MKACVEEMGEICTHAASRDDLLKRYAGELVVLLGTVLLLTHAIDAGVFSGLEATAVFAAVVFGNALYPVVFGRSTHSRPHTERYHTPWYHNTIL